MAKRVDANQSAVVEALRKLGASVQPLHTVGHGCPDLAIGFRGRTYLAEVKDGEKRWTMTPDQVKFHAEWRAPIAVLDSVESAVAWIKRLTEH